MPKHARLTFLLGWLIPGAGHWYVGRRGKALLFFVLLMSIFFVGFALGDFKNVYFSHQRIAILGQICLGLPTILISFRSILSFLSEAYGKSASLTFGLGPREFFPLYDVGTIYTVIAGLLNFVVALDAYRLATLTGHLRERSVRRALTGSPEGRQGEEK